MPQMLKCGPPTIHSGHGPLLNLKAALGPPVHLAHCVRPGCKYVASATRSGQEIRALAAHLIACHMPAPKDAA